MRTVHGLVVALITAVPLAAYAKEPSFGDVISELSLPARIQPGDTVMVAAKIDVAAYCRRTTTFGGPNCVQDATPGTSAEIVLHPTSTAPETSARLVDIAGRVDRGADGVYRGTLKTLPCQKEGAYRATAQEPNPLLAAAEMIVDAVPACTADRVAPMVKSVRLPERLKLPARPPADNTGWTHGRLVVDIDDDASGAYQLAYELTPADDASSSYGGSSIDCAPCGGHWACTADVPLCAVAELGDLAVRVKWVTDRAGRQTSWQPPQEAPFAIIKCGSESAPPPTLVCAAPPASDPPASAADGGTTPEPTGGGADAQAPGTSPPKTDPEPPSLVNKDSGCSIAGGQSGAGAAGLSALLLATLALAGRRRRTRRRTR
ncbi:MAG: hypothetical protein QOI66_1431 [Myxococcales bacterium]|jgi:hypothetical protein|nr:hypothetical protein [Myxococcales bacterium]